MGVVAPMFKVSLELEPETVSVAVNVLASVTTMVAAVMSPLANVMLGVCAVLNSNPSGALRTNVPPPISPRALPVSAITIAPRLVQAGTAASAAVSAEILPPPLATVKETFASTLLARVTMAVIRSQCPL